METLLCLTSFTQHSVIYPYYVTKLLKKALYDYFSISFFKYKN